MTAGSFLRACVRLMTPRRRLPLPLPLQPRVVSGQVVVKYRHRTASRHVADAAAKAAMSVEGLDPIPGASNSSAAAVAAGPGVTTSTRVYSIIDGASVEEKVARLRGMKGEAAGTVWPRQP